MHRANPSQPTTAGQQVGRNYRNRHNDSILNWREFNLCYGLLDSMPLDRLASLSALQPPGNCIGIAGELRRRDDGLLGLARAAFLQVLQCVDAGRQVGASARLSARRSRPLRASEAAYELRSDHLTRPTTRRACGTTSRAGGTRRRWRRASSRSARPSRTPRPQTASCRTSCARSRRCARGPPSVRHRL
jgi:hypothetical protein